ncbi:ferredoxin [Actinokineospora bangkokensis]|uniref:Ferredoxin n=1 Tax=Actinokineospora bangkokensis TaxID=1193682 RepID=A0A1Q9LNG2_9PSEU|nr:ferredoxin [Actinokineospora bangkokensis]OLR93555.1 ferredoxin [Actinokineospora bangkokensis]
MRVEIDEDRCCGAGMCVLAAPEVFGQRDEDGVVILLDAAPGEEQRAAVSDAIAQCPALAITLDGAG